MIRHPSMYSMIIALVAYVIITANFGEYVVSREMNSYLQLFFTLAWLFVSGVLFKMAYNYFKQLTKNKKV